MTKFTVTCALTFGLCSMGCSRDTQPRTAHDGQAAQVGAEVGSAVDDAAEATSEAARDAAEEAGLEGRHRYRCATGEEFSVDFRNEGEAALIERSGRQYWLELEEGTGRYSSQQGGLWIIDDEVATLELQGVPVMRNCTRQ